MNRFFNRPSSAGQAFLIDGELFASGVDRLAQTADRKVGELLCDRLEPAPYLVEFSGHGRDRIG